MTTSSLFLATTALKSHWDQAKHLLFLGPWCLRYREQATYQGLSYQVLQDQWQDETLRQSAQIYIEDLHERFLSALTIQLNELLKVNHTLRFWAVLLGPWLRVYLTVLYDRFSSLEKVYTFFPEIKTIGLSHADHQLPRTHAEFNTLLATDEYNLQIYTQISAKFKYRN